LQLSPYAAALRLHLLSLPTTPDRVRQLLQLDPPIFDGTPGVWADLCGAENRHSATRQIHLWIRGAACHVARFQPPGYVPAPKRSGRRAATPVATPEPATTPPG